MEQRIQMLANSYGIDQLCADHDINPEFIVRFLLDEGLITLEEYFEEEEEEETND